MFNLSKCGQKTCSKLKMYMRVVFAHLNLNLLEEETKKNDENFSYTYFEKQYVEMFYLIMYFFHKEQNVHATNMCYNKRCSPPIKVHL